MKELPERNLCVTADSLSCCGSTTSLLRLSLPLIMVVNNGLFLFISLSFHLYLV